MAETIGEHVQEVTWSFAVQEVFFPQSNDNKLMVVLAGNILSGKQDDPVGRPVRVFVGGEETGQGKIVSRFRFGRTGTRQSAYVYDGISLNRDDIRKKIVLVAMATCSVSPATIIDDGD